MVLVTLDEGVTVLEGVIVRVTVKVLDAVWVGLRLLVTVRVTEGVLEVV